MSDLIAQLVDIRRQRGLTTGDVAKRMHCSMGNVSHFENRRRSPTLVSIERYAAAVGAHITAHQMPAPPPVDSLRINYTPRFPR